MVSPVALDKVKGSGFVVNETDILTPANLTKILEQLK